MSPTSSSIVTGKGRRQGKNKSGKLNEKKRGTKKDKDYTDDSDEEDEDDILFKASELLNPPKHNFWADIEPYFAHFTDDDLRFISPQQMDPDDPAFIIPPLGKSQYDDFSKREQEMDNQGEIRVVVACGEVTQRILSALIDEKAISSDAITSTTTLDSLLKDEETDVVNSNGKNSRSWITPTESCLFSTESEYLPLHVAPTYDYSFNKMLSIEDRIKLELRSIGLLDDEDLDVDTLHREDDEICSELRKLQQQLKERMKSNNSMRTKLASLVGIRMTKEEAERKEKEHNRQLDREYIKLVKREKKGKGRKGKHD
eukprot:TRINITY_DN6347_c0_g1_i2.p1 TRINITY_DN6347_c0_g1~~TRINITY_DN6347_c0_g1_i2.p1  ORF type:complete len:314 (-),score=107.21 TRINITY_DN6347_c0_g1_i2:87-1028(-)